ncbi:MAG: hypothetical protein HY072_01950 [Deltaproteobacteria bacterium]|nr:hypothetical protein [Deltaproteobacteria bacterium]
MIYDFTKVATMATVVFMFSMGVGFAQNQPSDYSGYLKCSAVLDRINKDIGDNKEKPKFFEDSIYTLDEINKRWVVLQSNKAFEVSYAGKEIKFTRFDFKDTLESAALELKFPDGKTKYVTINKSYNVSEISDTAPTNEAGNPVTDKNEKEVKPTPVTMKELLSPSDNGVKAIFYKQLQHRLGGLINRRLEQLVFQYSVSKSEAAFKHDVKTITDPLSACTSLPNPEAKEPKATTPMQTILDTAILGHSWQKVLDKRPTKATDNGESGSGSPK